MIKIKSHELRLPPSEEQWRIHIALIIVNLFFCISQVFCIHGLRLQRHRVSRGVSRSWKVEKAKNVVPYEPPNSFSYFIHLFHPPGDMFLNWQFWRVVSSSNRYGFSNRNLLVCNVWCLEQLGLKKRTWGSQRHCLVMDVLGDSPISINNNCRTIIIIIFIHYSSLPNIFVEVGTTDPL